MELFDAIRSRRSVRQFLPEPVPRKVLEEIVAAGIEAPSGCNMQLRQYVIVDDPKTMDAIRPVSKAMATAPSAVVVLLEPKATPYGDYHVQDASAAIENMLLAAVALGYGACWVEGQVRRQEGVVRQALGVPEHLRVWAVLPVGRAVAQPQRPAKSLPGEVVHYNAFGVKA